MAGRRRRPRGRLGSIAAGGALLAGAWYGLRSQSIQRADVRLGEALRRRSGPLVDRAVVGTTDLGSLYAVGGMSAVLAVSGRQRTAAELAGLGGLTWAVSQRSKTVVQRARPYERDGVRRLIREPAGSSFPSGHAAVAAAAAHLLAERARHRPVRWALGALGAYVGATRVYVGVHYPSDVLGGAGIGLMLAGSWSLTRLRRCRDGPSRPDGDQ